MWSWSYNCSRARVNNVQLYDMHVFYTVVRKFAMAVVRPVICISPSGGKPKLDQVVWRLLPMTTSHADSTIGQGRHRC